MGIFRLEAGRRRFMEAMRPKFLGRVLEEAVPN